jgi:hypothetical protein
MRIEQIFDWIDHIIYRIWTIFRFTLTLINYDNLLLYRGWRETGSKTSSLQYFLRFLKVPLLWIFFNFIRCWVWFVVTIKLDAVRVSVVIMTMMECVGDASVVHIKSIHVGCKEMFWIAFVCVFLVDALRKKQFSQFAVAILAKRRTVKSRNKMTDDFIKWLGINREYSLK